MKITLVRKLVLGTKSFEIGSVLDLDSRIASVMIHNGDAEPYSAAAPAPETATKPAPVPGKRPRGRPRKHPRPGV